MKKAASMLLATTAILCAAPVVAGEISSVYTSLKLEKCKLMESNPNEGGSAVWSCRGHGGMPVRVVEGDLRYYVSYGPNARKQTSAGQTLGPFNNIHHTLEWRVERRDGRWVPFATILRYFWDSGDGRKGQTLVVTKLGRNDACHVAHVEASGNPNANKMARKAADVEARRFDCANSRSMRYMPNGQRESN